MYCQSKPVLLYLQEIPGYKWGLVLRSAQKLKKCPTNSEEIFLGIEESTSLPGASKDVANKFVLEKFKCAAL